MLRSTWGRVGAWAFPHSFHHGTWERRAALHLGLALPVLLVGIWFSTGTLAPYSATDAPRELLDCGYTANIDHGDFLHAYWMLKGYPVEDWGKTIALRRLLYPALAFPFSQTFGFYLGGLAANVLIHIVTLIGWTLFLFHTVGRRGAVAGTWMLATYPGIMYWVGLPYAHAMIVPATVGCFVALHALCTRRPVGEVAQCGLAIGVLCQAYDLVAYFGPAALVLAVWYQRRVAAVLALLAGIAVPFAITYGLLVYYFEVPGLETSNTRAYTEIFAAYLRLLSAEVDWSAWMALVAAAPGVLMANFFDSNFTVLPAFFLALLVANLLTTRIGLHPASAALLGVIVLVHLFNNLAPPYEGWQMRGEWIARLYQPAFVVMMFFAARLWRAVDGRAPAARAVVAGPIALAVVLQAMVVGGGLVANWEFSNRVYTRFYNHYGLDGYHRHLETYGRRPLGFCVPPERQPWPRMRQAKN